MLTANNKRPAHLVLAYVEAYEAGFRVLILVCPVEVVVHAGGAAAAAGEDAAEDRRGLAAAGLETTQSHASTFEHTSNVGAHLPIQLPSRNRADRVLVCTPCKDWGTWKEPIEPRRLKPKSLSVKM